MFLPFSLLGRFLLTGLQHSQQQNQQLRKAPIQGLEDERGADDGIKEQIEEVWCLESEISILMIECILYFRSCLSCFLSVLGHIFFFACLGSMMPIILCFDRVFIARSEMVIEGLALFFWLYQVLFIPSTPLEGASLCFHRPKFEASLACLV